jgi:hypothetical protein
MESNSVKHEIFEHKKWRRMFLKKLLKKGFRKKLFSSDLFFQQILHTSPIPRVSLEDLVLHPHIVLEDFTSRNGNLSLQEIAVLCSLISERGPKRLLEIGTFDGNTALQMALNAPEDAIVHTIDLPPGDSLTSQPVLESDIQFICDEKKVRRKYLGTRVERKISQHFGDSTNYDFLEFAKEGPLDCIFIDGGHSYECVKADTKNALRILGDQGWIFWHDFTPLFGGVYRFLCELSKELPLVHIEGTNLVLFDRREHL